MFGEESIYGQRMVTVDHKGRLMLPKFTGIEAQEILLIVDNIDYLSVCKEKMIEERVKQLKELYIDADLEGKRKIELELLKIYESVLKKVKSDNQHRINLGEIKTESNNFLCVGAKDHVIFKTKCVKK